ncbi:MAG: hypothetical protein IT259_08090 [Saprospiraceae bacterium]|nr:hypothetical protein [Saprospiraceae bacterium]
MNRFLQNAFSLALFAAFAFLFSFCQNNATDKKTDAAADAKPAPDTTVFSTERDTLIGFKGMERAAYTRPAAGMAEYRYQRYKIRTVDMNSQPGQSITITPLDSADGYNVPAGITGFFAGVVGDVLFMDIGTGPSLREILIFNLKTKKAVLKSEYVGDPEVLDNGKFWYLRPTDEKEVTKMPDCPERAEWEKNGFTVGYGQVCIYNPATNTEVRKSEWRCVQMQ